MSQTKKIPSVPPAAARDRVMCFIKKESAGVDGRQSSAFVGLSIIQQPTAAPGHPDWDGQADARRPRPWLAPGMWHPRIPLSSRMSRAARAASPVRDPPGAALTWVRRCLAVWEGRERAYQGASGRQPALSSGGGGPFAGATQRSEYV